MLAKPPPETVPTLQSRSEAERCLKQLAHLTGLLGCAVAARDEAVLTVNARHQPLIDSLGKNMEALRLRLEEWARANKAVEFVESQTLQMPDGKLFFRKGNRALVPIEGWDDALVLGKLLEIEARDACSMWCQYIKREPQVDERRLLADTAGKEPILPVARLKTIGLELQQKERFHVEVRPGPACFDVPQ